VTGPEHYRRAEERIKACDWQRQRSPKTAALEAACAQAHAILALAAATDPGIAAEPITRRADQPERCGCGKLCPPGQWWCGDPCVELKPEASG
jgi:hypothetical protein